MKRKYFLLDSLEFFLLYLVHRVKEERNNDKRKSTWKNWNNL